MRQLSGFGRLALGAFLMATAAIFVSGIPWLTTFGGHPTSAAFEPVEEVLRTGTAGANAWRWAYLGWCTSSILLVPGVLYVHGIIRSRSPRSLDMALFAAMVSLVTAAVAAAAMGVAGSSLIHGYADAAPAQQSGIVMSFQLLRDVVHFGIHEGFARLTFGIAVGSVAWTFRRDRPLVAGLGIILGVATVAIALATLLGSTSRYDQYLILAVMILAALGWTVIIGVRRLLRGLLSKSQASSV